MFWPLVASRPEPVGVSLIAGRKPASAFVSTRAELRTYASPLLGMMSMIDRFVIVASGNVTSTRYVSRSPICTNRFVESGGRFVSLVA